MPPYPCKIDGVQMLCLRMETLVARDKNALRYCDWVSHVKIERGEISHSSHMYDIRLFIEHLEVFKKPPEVDELPTIIYGSSKMHVNLEDDKEYLICGK
ncbi:hypothetical protein PRIPAC_84939 [Pristionchus pacificus]|uniref:Uncharacterized protein n=1 Tax=Pristionchus pacificus TaxID=54126 RepID=A0A2A6CEI9_PRIPA|nr:hypothetical protein PRIPAC_84939 [Pristionchus pacificus]|eukprot:PDM76526.1 hypothetical protein PRIPAC_42892 [Pristionchus pacificus]